MKKNLFLALGTTALAFAAVGASFVNVAPDYSPVSAGSTTYSLVGTMDSGDDAWNVDHDMGASTKEGYDAYYRITLEKDVEFKIRKDHAWDSNWGYTNLEAGHIKNNYVSASGTDNIKNIKIKVAGTYDLWFSASNNAILMEYADTGATYVFAQKEFTNAYIWDKTSGDEPWGWGSAPAYYVLPIQKANDMRINNSGGSYHDYHAFRINQNLLDHYKVILKGSMGQTCNLYADSPCVIMDTGQDGEHITYSTTNGYYKLCKMMVDISGSMGAAKYKGRDYAYSICHTSQAESAAIATAYDGLLADDDATVRNITPKVVLNTYNDFNAEYVEYSKAEISISKVIEVLRGKGTGAIVTPSTALSVSGMSAQNSAALIVGLAVLGLAAGGTMVFLAKRRKEI